MLFLESNINVKQTVAMYIPEHKKKQAFAKELCNSIKHVMQKKASIDVIRFVATEKSTTKFIEKELTNMQ